MKLMKRDVSIDSIIAILVIYVIAIWGIYYLLT